MTVSEAAQILTTASGTPQLDDSAFVAGGARIIGNVVIEERGSVWYNAVVRGDRAEIRIGARSNVQDNVSIHVDEGAPVSIGEDVSIGHNAVVHGCTIEDGSLIGMGAVVLSGAVIGAGSLVAAGAMVLAGDVIPPGSLVAGVPAKVRRSLSDDEAAGLLRNAAVYLELSAEHADAR
ncbi:gamma carbonic anhydrase family protein [Microbacterium gorillae]|uniref:gamma carbonic anhydrase family protein n=1 Tax=Microbacterium gorillae TaxID=1231063 RepID=UPI003D9774DD